MKKPVYLLLLTFVCLTAAVAQTAAPAKPAQSTAPPTFTQVMDRSLGYPESEVVPAADAMPNDKYDFAPASNMGDFKGVRTFGQQVRHIAATQYLICAAIQEQKPPVELGGENGPENIKTKADSVKFLKDSFAYCHTVYKTINESNAATQVKAPFGQGKASKLGLAVLNVGHDFDHYGQMVEYLRMNNVIPPASRGQQ